MGKTFGSRDANATNDVMGGAVVSTGTPGAATVRDPNQGLTDEQLRNRKFLRMGGGLMNHGLNQQQPIQHSTPVQFTFANNQPDYTPQPAQSPFFGRY
jgi:hypothetical protein